MMSYRIICGREKERGIEEQEESEGMELWGKRTRCHVGFSVRTLYQMRREDWPKPSCLNMAATCSRSRSVCEELIPSFGVIATKIPELAASHSFLLPWQSLIWNRPIRWMLLFFCWERCRDSGGLFALQRHVFQRARFTFLTSKIHTAYTYHNANVQRQNWIRRTAWYQTLECFIISIFHLIIINERLTTCHRLS